MRYTTFDQFLEESPQTSEARNRFVHDWLKTSYGIDQAPQSWVDQISDVHDHDEQPKHFGQIKIASAFTSMTTQLVKLHGVWHFSITVNNADRSFIIHPLTEKTSVENEKLRLNLMRLLKSGKVSTPTPTYAINFDKFPATQADFTDIYTQKDTETATMDDMKTAPIKPETRTTSVGIDLSAYL